jgi:aspartyl-tRNA(Asn)/glutamyl-tRNA(Gln) amidotransferase subunit A
MSDALRERTVSSAELLQSSFDSIDKTDSQVKAFISYADRDQLLAQAREIDAQRAAGRELPRFAGVPIAVKDNIAVKGQPLTCGSRILENYVAPYTSTAAQRALDAGLLILGKTNMDEFGFGSSTENSAFHPTRNPHALDRIPGGSSGGSAAAVATGMVPWALGTDTGGSVRQPAAMCGVVGFRPTYGRISRFGLVAFASSLDVIGPLATTVEDAASLTELIMGLDPRDNTSLPDRADLHSAPKKMRLGIPGEYMSDACQPEIQEAVQRAAQQARDLGWTVDRVSLPLTEYALYIYYVVASVEAASNLARYDGVKYGYRAPGASNWDEMIDRSRTYGFGAEAKRRIMLGTFAASAGYQDKFYINATKVRRKLADEFATAFCDFDVLLSPISPTTAWKIGEKIEDPMTMYLQDIYSVPAALAGIPALVIPSGRDNAGLPIGLQLSGPRGADANVIAAGRALENVLTPA